MVSGGISGNPGSVYYYILDARLDQASAEARVDAPMAAEHPVAFRQPHAQTIDTYLLRAIGHLNRMNYTLYTIGARGTVIGAFEDATDRFRSNLTPGISSIAYRDEDAGLEILSRGTGGLAFHNSANFFGALSGSIMIRLSATSLVMRHQNGLITRSQTNFTAFKSRSIEKTLTSAPVAVM